MTPPLGATLRAAEVDAIQRALASTHGNVRAAALALGVPYSTLQRRITELGLRAHLTAHYPRAGRQPRR